MRWIWKPVATCKPCGLTCCMVWPRWLRIGRRQIREPAAASEQRTFGYLRSRSPQAHVFRIEEVTKALESDGFCSPNSMLQLMAQTFGFLESGYSRPLLYGST